MKIAFKILLALGAPLLLSACASGPLSTGTTYEYKQMVLPVTWGESEFKIALLQSNSYNEPAKKLRWVRVGGNVAGTGFGGYHDRYSNYGTIKEGLPTINRGDLVELFTSDLYHVNLDTLEGTTVVIRIVCRKDDKACMSLELGKLKSNVIGSITPAEWAAVPRAKR